MTWKQHCSYISQCRWLCLEEKLQCQNAKRFLTPTVVCSDGGVFFSRSVPQVLAQGIHEAVCKYRAGVLREIKAKAMMGLGSLSLPAMGLRCNAVARWLLPAMSWPMRIARPARMLFQKWAGFAQYYFLTTQTRTNQSTHTTGFWIVKVGLWAGFGRSLLRELTTSSKFVPRIVDKNHTVWRSKWYRTQSN